MTLALLTSCDSDELRVTDFNDVISGNRLSVLLTGVHNEGAYTTPRRLNITTTNYMYMYMYIHRPQIKKTYSHQKI